MPDNDAAILLPVIVARSETRFISVCPSAVPTGQRRKSLLAQADSGWRLKVKLQTSLAGHLTPASLSRELDPALTLKALGSAKSLRLAHPRLPVLISPSEEP